MGQKTAATLITEGLQYAGNTSLSTLALAWLNEWLRATYAEGDWEFLRRDISGVALAAGTTVLTVGVGQNGITPEIKEINEPIGVYDSAYSTNVKAKIVSIDNNWSATDERMMNTTLWRGVPREFRVRMTAGTFGQWKLYPRPVPDRAYLLAFDYYEQPADMTLSSQTPLYPNDETMVFAVASRAILHQHGPDSPKFQAIGAELGPKVDRDRAKYITKGLGSTLQLDGGVFR